MSAQPWREWLAQECGKVADQVRALHAAGHHRVYLYGKIGELRALEAEVNSPRGFALVTPTPVPPCHTRSATITWVLDMVQSFPCLPPEEQ